MSRAEQRVKVRENKKSAKEINKLTPNQVKLIDSITEFRTNELIEVYKRIVDMAVYNTMRANKISDIRANKIMGEANKIIVNAIRGSE